jgi:hypothetical protein
VSLKHWITLFDDVDDDGFDGELGEDDEELPMILTTFQLLPESVEEERPISKSPVKEP